MRCWRADAQSLLLSIPVALLGGIVWRWLNWPLPWMIGPLVACAFCNAAGVGLRAPVMARNVGQWVIGAALGTYFTAEALSELLVMGLPLLFSLVFTLLLGAGFAWALHRFAGASIPTAVFGGAVGSASEMALLGERHGARVETIAAVHSTRVLLVVLIIPFAYRWLELQGVDEYVPGRTDINMTGVCLLLFAAACGGLFLRRFNAPNSWMIGPLLVSVAMTSTGYLPSGVPGLVSNAAQLLIGLSLGTKFETGFFARAPRLLTVVIVATLMAMLLSAAFGLGLAAFSGIAPATMVLATAPGGIAEMSITAKILKLGVPVVTSFHIFRLLVLILAAGYLYRFVGKRSGWPVHS